MVLRLGITSPFSGVGNLFKNSPDDNQVLHYEGDKQIPGDVAGTTWDLTDDFNSDTLDTSMWNSNVSGGTLTFVNGVMTINTPANNDRIFVNSIKSWRLDVVSKIEFSCRVKQTIHANADNQIMVGLVNDPTGNPSVDNAIWISLTTTADQDDANLNTTKNSTTTQADSNLDSGTWYELKIVATAASIEFWRNGILIGTHSTNIPDDVGLFPYFRLLNSDAANEDYTLEVDWCRVKVT